MSVCDAAVDLMGRGAFVVSILVLVDVGPRFPDHLCDEPEHQVSILVLVDVGPRFVYPGGVTAVVNIQVSILVLVDVGPRL